MATYKAWNSALATFFVSGVSKGSHIFLSLDEETVEEMAAGFLDKTEDRPCEDLVAAVRSACVDQSSDGVNLDVFAASYGKIPAGVAFLGVMVLAACRMKEEEGVDESNYFLRLREILGLKPIRGRPKGMPPGAEKPLWLAWNRFLVALGYTPTSEEGAGPQTYLRYVFSQAILRESDKGFLRQRYRDSKIPRNFDSDQLGFWLSRQPVNRKHLSEGLQHPDPVRAWEFRQSAYRVYEPGDWANNAPQLPSQDRSSARRIECGIFRFESLVGDVQYLTFPKQPGRSRHSELSVSDETGRSEKLREFRPGFFRPLWPQKPFLDKPIELPVGGDPLIKSLVLPQRDFWILTFDPETERGAIASWKPYLDLGEKFMVLCRKGPYSQEMSRFREAGLIDWSHEIDCGGWFEYIACMVVSYGWGGFVSNLDCRALSDALEPRAEAGVSCSGGLRDQNQNAWLAGFPPTLRVYGFENRFDLTVIGSRGAQIVFNAQPVQQDIVLPTDLDHDTYRIQVNWNGRRVASRMFRIVAWSDIMEHPNPPEVINADPISTAGLRLRGPIVCRQPHSESEKSDA